MALTKDKKSAVIDEVKQLLSTSKMTVISKYQGTTVKAMQDLRTQARESGTKVKVIKNRLVIKALEQSEGFQAVDKSLLEGMLLYAFNPEDEVAPAQAIASFAKANPSLEFVGAITADGKLLLADEVKALATLPGKAELIAQVLATLGSPLNDVLNGLSGNLHSLLDGIEMKTTN